MFKHLKALVQRRELLYFLALKDVKIRFKFSTLGFTWAFISPLATMLVLSAVFSFIVRFGPEASPYPVFLLVALLPWTYFQLALNQATTSLLDNDNLIRKVYFPREIIPLGSVVSNLFDFSVSLLILFIFLLAFGIPLTRWLLLFPLMLLIELMFTVGVALFLAGLTVVYRDIKYIKEILMLFWFYASPIFYPETFVPDWLRPFYYLNPMAGVIHGFRAILFYGRAPSPLIVGYTALAAGAVMLFGYRLFKRYEPLYADLV
jgi:ABC-type polysaccharide/polyol phosphate export permease